jgi:hypothetical protein
LGFWVVKAASESFILHMWRWPNVWYVSKSISSDAHYLTLQKDFSHPSLVFYFFFQPRPYNHNWDSKLVGLLIANNLDQLLWLANHKQGARVRSYLLHSSQACARLCCAFKQPKQTLWECWAQTILLSQVDCSSSNFNLKVTYWAKVENCSWIHKQIFVVAKTNDEFKSLSSHFINTWWLEVL